ncbi:MAG: hypothetical protein V3V00_14200 [Saprospiraceae bacterium]
MKKFLHEEIFIEVGFVKKAYGYKGDIKLAIQDEYEEDVLNAAFIFINQKGLKVPFKVAKALVENEIIVKFNTIDTLENANLVIGQTIFLLQKEIKFAQKYLNKNNEKNEFIGFEIFDSQSKLVLEIIRIEEFPQQLMAVVINNNAEAYIPLNDQFITVINREKKQLEMNLPEGLLDL